MTVKRRCARTNKVIYKRHQDAARVITLLSKRLADAAAHPESIYQCEHCHRWHVTSYTADEVRGLQQAKRRMGSLK